MSMTSWRREFYPITARSAARKGDKAALDHSIQKWRGLQLEALERHDVTPGEVDNAIGIDENSCSLCQRFRHRDPGGCDVCPLSRVRGDTPCCARRPDELEAPWAAWVGDHDSGPMLAWLLLAREKSAS